MKYIVYIASVLNKAPLKNNCLFPTPNPSSQTRGLTNIFFRPAAKLKVLPLQHDQWQTNALYAVVRIQS